MSGRRLLAGRERQCVSRGVSRSRCALGAENRRTAVVVHEISAELSVQRLEVVVHGHTELPAIACVTIRTALDQYTFVIDVDAKPIHQRQTTTRSDDRALAEQPQVVIAAACNDVRLGEKCPAVIGDGLLPIH